MQQRQKRKAAARCHNHNLLCTMKETLNWGKRPQVRRACHERKKQAESASRGSENATGFAASLTCACACVINCSGCISCTLCPHSTLPFQVQFGWKSPCCPLQRGNISPNKSDASHPTPTELFVGSCPSCCRFLPSDASTRDRGGIYFLEKLLVGGHSGYKGQSTGDDLGQ